MRKRALCAICDNTNEITWICAPCRGDPANIDWQEQPWQEASLVEIFPPRNLPNISRIQKVVEMIQHLEEMEVLTGNLLSIRELARQSGYSPGFVHRFRVMKRKKLNESAELFKRKVCD